MLAWRRRTVLAGFAATWGLGTAALAWEGCTPRMLTPEADAAFPGFDVYAPPLDVLQPDVLQPDTGPQPVTVTVLAAEGGPVAGVMIVWSDAAGATIGTSTTDATGTASMLVPSGSQVTALLGTAAAPELLTYVGIEPGDVLTPVEPPLLVSTVVANVNVANDAPDGSANVNIFSGNCSDYYYTVTGPFQHYLYPMQGCTAGNAFPLLLEAYDPGGAFMGYAYQRANVVDLDSGTADANVASAWYPAKDTHRLDVTNFPDGGYAYAVFSEVADGVPLYAGSSLTSNPDGGATSTTFVTHPAYPDSIQSEVNFTGFYLGKEQISVIATRGKPMLGSTAAIDLSALLPLLNTSMLDKTVPDRPVVTFGGPTPVAGDGTIVWFQANEALEAGSLTHTWMFVVPPNAQTSTVVTPPALPTSAGAWKATGALSTYDVPSVISIEGDTLKDYAAFRQVAGALPSVPAFIFQAQNTSGPYVPPLPFDGTLRFTAFSPFHGG